ncbi:hypothetical protein BB560_006954 [Smittium megazygosporum]|uniref:Uncharacterized protein n=1 Tax=Smittium megazygosporum TaxID=133381 RepID=A0A2T9Y004_9FUNG|nr:hypothetical protein BB560_006954 [Smittium megazygosporum]
MNNELQQTIVHLQQQVETLSAALKQMGISNTSFQADETPQERIYANEGKSQSMAPGKSTTSITAGLKGMNVSNCLLHNQPRQSKQDTLLSQQQILDLGSIAIHIEELVIGLRGIQNPSEPKDKGFTQEINGSAQDLLRIAFNYSSKVKHTRRTGIVTNSGYDRDTATSALESELAEIEYLFRPGVLSRMEEHRSKSRNYKLLQIAKSFISFFSQSI